MRRILKNVSKDERQDRRFYRIKLAILRRLIPDESKVKLLCESLAQSFFQITFY